MRLHRLRAGLLGGLQRWVPVPSWPESRIVQALGVAVTVLLMVAAAAMVLRERDQAQQARLDHQRLLARAMIDQATRSVDAASLLLATLARHVAAEGAAAAALQRPALAALLMSHPEVRHIAMLDRQGRVLSSSDADSVGLTVNAEILGPWPESGRERLARWTAGRGLPGLTGLSHGPGDAAAHPAVGSLPLLRSAAHGADEYLLVLLLHPDQLATAMRSMAGETAIDATLAAFDGHIVATTSQQLLPGKDLSTHGVFAQRLRERDQQMFVGAGLLSADALVAVRASPSRPLVVVVEQERVAAMAAAVWKSTRGAVIWAALAAVALLVMTWIAGRGLRARERARRRLDHAQAGIRRREQELSLLFGNLLHGVFRCTTDGTLTFANARWSELVGPGAAAAAVRRLDQWVLEDDLPALQQLLQERPPGEVRLAVLRMRAPGERRFEFSVTPHYVASKLAGFFGSAVEVTERDRALGRLAEELAFSANLIELNPLPTSLLDEQGRYLAVNRAWEQLTGKLREQVLGAAAGRLLDPQEASVHDRVDLQLRADGQPVRYTVQYTRGDGSRRDLLLHKVLVPGRAGAVPAIMATVLDVTELRDAERALAEARDRAEDASRVKSEFIANVSHELRTPLQSIIGFAELGLADELVPQRRALFDDIHASGQRMLALVNDLLDVARIDSVVGPIHLERCDLRPLAREVAAELRTQAHARNLRVELQLPASPLVVKADPLRLQQVLRNLLANAIRFSPIGGVVVIDAAPAESGGVSVRVTDRGPGIPPADLERIFEAFAQSSGTPSGAAGTGLGLAISRKIAKAHGGWLQAENLAEGGSRFHLRLPARTPGETRPARLEG